MSDIAATPAEETKTVQFTVSSGLANEVLALFGVPVPDAADLSEIRILIRDPKAPLLD